MNAIFAVLAMFSVSPSISGTADLVGDWEGLSLCADKVAFPNVKDEQVVYHVKVKDAKTILVRACKIVNGKEEEMSTDPLALEFNLKEQSLTGQIGGRKPSIWTFHLTYSNWVGTAKDPDGKLYRNILVKRR